MSERPRTVGSLHGQSGLPSAASRAMLGGMEAVRCLRCGATRWSYRAGTLRQLLSEPCEDCGGPVVRERRRPGSLRGALPIERRQGADPVLPRSGRTAAR
jgi:hypothetical protein